ncbi:MAG: hypothetical protein J0L92_37715 [Deltaproteobacteria bacterium]|nr:hypothetical protein [Deltaproteobacteria bacterium]
MRWLLLVVVMFVALRPDRARACATCGAGDPAAQIAGAEQPFAGRVRLVGVLLHTSYADGDATVFDQRALLGGSIAIDDVALFAVTLPLVWRESFDASLAHDTSFGVGDLDLRLRVTLLRDRAFAPEHRLLLEIGSRVPSAPALTRGDGRIAPLASQTGTGAFEPLLGLSWLASIRETQLLLSLQGAFPTTGFGGWRNGPALRSSAALQWQPIPELALRATLDARLEGPSGRGQELSGESFVLHAGGGIVVAPSSDVVLHLVVRVPALQVLDTAHRARADGVTVEAGVGLDV